MGDDSENVMTHGGIEKKSRKKLIRPTDIIADGVCEESVRVSHFALKTDMRAHTVDDDDSCWFHYNKLLLFAWTAARKSVLFRIMIL